MPQQPSNFRQNEINQYSTGNTGIDPQLIAEYLANNNILSIKKIEEIGLIETLSFLKRQIENKKIPKKSYTYNPIGFKK